MLKTVFSGPQLKQVDKWIAEQHGVAIDRPEAMRRLVARVESEEMTATNHGRRSWKDSPKAKRIAATISLLLIAGLIAMLALAFLFTQ
jgi:hypothetical protein